MLPHLKLTPSARLAQGTQPSPLVLRRTALYWDAIKVPMNDIFDIALPRTSEVRDLMAAGVLREEIVYTPKPFGIPPGVPNIVPSGREEMSAFLVRTQWELFLHHEGKEPGSWTIAQDGGELVVAVPESESATTAEIELHNLLPVPRDDVPIGKVLEFKQKRDDELQRLRSELDGLCEQIGSAQNVPRVRDHAVDKVHTAVADLFKAMGEDFATTVARRAVNSLSLGTFLSVAAAVTHIHVPPLISTAAGLFRFKIGDGKAPKKLARTGPFAYVYDVMSEIM